MTLQTNIIYKTEEEILCIEYNEKLNPMNYFLNGSGQINTDSGCNHLHFKMTKRIIKLFNPEHNTILKVSPR